MPFLFSPPPALIFRQPLFVVPLPPDAPRGQSDYETWDADRLFQFGTNLLRNGRSFNRASQVLEIALHKRPENAEYGLALGCAYASRFASVAYAARRAKGYDFHAKNYPTLRAAWEKAQKDPKDSLYGTPSPTPPVPPATPDDNRPLSLTPDQAKQELLCLGAQSLQAFETARAHIADLPPAKQSEARFIYGWGLFTLRREGIDQKVIQDAPPYIVNPAKNDKTAETPDKRIQSATVLPFDFTQAVESFRLCVAAQPDDARYAQSLGWALVPDYLDGKAGDWGSEVLYWERGGPHYPKEIRAEAVKFFESALARKPRDFDILYSLALVTAAFDPNASAAYLEKAAARQANNSVLWYLAADLRFRQAEAENDMAAKEMCQVRAIAAIERGNAAPDFKSNNLSLPIPPYLRAVWKYRPAKGFGNEGAVLNALYTHVSDYLTAQDAAHHTDTLLRGASAQMEMGVKAARSVTDDPALTGSLSDLWEDSSGRAVRAMTGWINGIGAYQSVLHSQQADPDERKANFLKQNERNFNYFKSVDRGLFPQ